MRKRLLLTLPTLLVITILLFGAVQLLPGGPAAVACGEICSEEEYEELKEALGLNDPLWQRYWRWLASIGQGEFGTSLASGSPIGQQIKDRTPVTLELGLLGMLIGCVIALPIGVLSAVRQDTIIDYVVRAFSAALIAIPGFWLAIVLIAAGYRTGIWTPPLNYTPLTEDPVENIKIIIVPAIILGLGLSGGLMRMTRAQMLEVLRQDYVRTARSKGLRESLIVYRHAFRNAMVPVVTMIGLQVPVIVGGSVILESIFNLPGVGRYLIDAVLKVDIPVIQAVNLVVAAVVVLTNLVTDYLYTVIDPRIRVD